jgi:hypothetical protein
MRHGNNRLGWEWVRSLEVSLRHGRQNGSDCRPSGARGWRKHDSSLGKVEVAEFRRFWKTPLHMREILRCHFLLSSISLVALKVETLTWPPPIDFCLVDGISISAAQIRGRASNPFQKCIRNFQAEHQKIPILQRKHEVLFAKTSSFVF